MTKKSKHKAKIEELKQRVRHREVVKEINTRQKQIFWKHQTCIFIKQAGYKYRMVEQIKKIAHKKWVQQMRALTQKGCGKLSLKEELERRLGAKRRAKEELKAKQQEHEQWHRQKKVVKEIKMRQKQIFWKEQCCIFIKQAGHKYRMTKLQTRKGLKAKGIIAHPRVHGEEHKPGKSHEIVKFAELVSRLSETSDKQEHV